MRMRCYATCSVFTPYTSPNHHQIPRTGRLSYFWLQRFCYTKALGKTWPDMIYLIVG